MSNDTQHDPREVEALAVEVFKAMYPSAGWSETEAASHCLSRPVARMILRRESAQKADAERLVAALERLACLGNGSLPGNSVGNVIAQDALAAHRATKPGEPTLREAVEELVRDEGTFRFPVGEPCVVVPSVVIQRIANALARERSRDGGK